MRTLTGLMMALTLGLASAATATSITVDTDKKTYFQSETITVTTTLVVSPGHSSQLQLVLELLWSDLQIEGDATTPPALKTFGPTVASAPLTSLAGVLPWLHSHRGTEPEPRHLGGAGRADAKCG